MTAPRLIFMLCYGQGSPEARPCIRHLRTLDDQRELLCGPLSFNRPLSHFWAHVIVLAAKRRRVPSCLSGDRTQPGLRKDRWNFINQSCFTNSTDAFARFATLRCGKNLAGQFCGHHERNRFRNKLQIPAPLARITNSRGRPVGLPFCCLYTCNFDPDPASAGISSLVHRWVQIADQFPVTTAYPAMSAFAVAWQITVSLQRPFGLSASAAKTRPANSARAKR